MIRSFLAIKVPNVIVTSLVSLQADIPTGRIVPPHNLHVTLAFLGMQSTATLKELDLMLGALEIPAFELRIAGLDQFSKGHSPVVFAKVDPCPGLKYLRNKVLQAGRACDIELPRARFRPHVTLARLGRRQERDAQWALEAFMIRNVFFTTPQFDVGAFGLYRSNLTDEGPIYEELARYRLW